MASVKRKWCYCIDGTTPFHNTIVPLSLLSLLPILLSISSNNQPAEMDSTWRESPYEGPLGLNSPRGAPKKVGAGGCGRGGAHVRGVTQRPSERGRSGRTAPAQCADSREIWSSAAWLRRVVRLRLCFIDNLSLELSQVARLGRVCPSSVAPLALPLRGNYNCLASPDPVPTPARSLPDSADSASTSERLFMSSSNSSFEFSWLAMLPDLMRPADRVIDKS